ncbi:MAG: shikimate dehydrogenase [Candidatus Viridilinea halotolerans]|uniref:Shikimate dehydrogenase (NADP(+)) n=1 Tax=Candidatus Viridilinea halotolerans TaxID=2491704 RepID=A0A426TPA9_9CHLR|nr:MAG: shikimate dehydrogenase [Candidatus Viridilinea halotolerans]
MNINGHTKIIGFFGSTYQTSKMYALYNSAMQSLDLNYLYVPFAVDDLQRAVEGVRHLGIAAIGITIPYKVAIMSYLDELDPTAQRIGAVNVVINRDKRLIGYNTDGSGALQALQEATSLAGKTVCLLGAGGAARAIAFALSDVGCPLTILNRTPSAAQALANAIGPDVAWGDYSALPATLAPTTIIINTTPVGMLGSGQETASLVPSELLQPSMVVMDIVTNPHETPLLQAACQRGCTLVYGQRMLLWQGVHKFALYTGVEPPLAVMAAAMGG